MPALPAEYVREFLRGEYVHALPQPRHDHDRAAVRLRDRSHLGADVPVQGGPPARGRRCQPNRRGAAGTVPAMRGEPCFRLVGRGKECTDCTVSDLLANEDQTLCLRPDTGQIMKEVIGFVSEINYCDQELVQSGLENNQEISTNSMSVDIFPAEGTCEEQVNTNPLRRLLQQTTTVLNWIYVRTFSTATKSTDIANFGLGEVTFVSTSATCPPGEFEDEINNQTRCRYCKKGKTGDGTHCDDRKQSKTKTMSLEFDNMTDYVNFTVVEPQNKSQHWEILSVYVQRRGKFYRGSPQMSVLMAVLWT